MSRVTVPCVDASQTRPNGAEQVICATGFRAAGSTTRCLPTSSTAHALETYERWIVLAPDSTVPALTDDVAHALARRRRRPVGLPRRRHDRRREVRGTRVPPPGMSYTLRGRIESRLASTVPALLLALGAAPLVGDRARRADARARPRPRRGRLPPRAAVPAGLARAAARRCSSSRSSTPACARSGSPRRSARRSLLYGVGWAGAQMLGHGALPATSARVRRGRRRARPRRRSSRRPRSPRRSSPGSAPRTRSARRPFTCTAWCKGRS